MSMRTDGPWRIEKGERGVYNIYGKNPDGSPALVCVCETLLDAMFIAQAPETMRKLRNNLGWARLRNEDAAAYLESLLDDESDWTFTADEIREALFLLTEAQPIAFLERLERANTLADTGI